MEEFDREGLPLYILANWRGFSGGQRDLFEGVLQVRPAGFRVQVFRVCSRRACSRCARRDLGFRGF
jgi:hypothetical protein